MSVKTDEWGNEIKRFYCLRLHGKPFFVESVNIAHALREASLATAYGDEVIEIREIGWATTRVQVLVSPREVHERAMELWVNEGAPGDELPEGRHYRRALADLEGEGMKRRVRRAE